MEEWGRKLSNSADVINGRPLNIVKFDYIGETRTRSLRHRRAHAVIHEDGPLQVLAGTCDVGFQLVLVRLVARWRCQELAGSQADRAVQGHPHQRIAQTPCPQVSGVLLVVTLLR